jgi:hypothetical protein
LWRQLPAEKQRQLAQQIGQLLQRQRQAPAQTCASEEHHADHSIIL